MVKTLQMNELTKTELTVLQKMQTTVRMKGFATIKQ
jgi:hypothetical protein